MHTNQFSALPLLLLRLRTLLFLAAFVSLCCCLSVCYFCIYFLTFLLMRRTPRHVGVATRKSLECAPNRRQAASGLWQSVTKTAAINGVQGQGRARGGKGGEQGGEYRRAASRTCQQFDSWPAVPSPRSSLVCLSVDWRHIFGRDNAAQLIFLSPVSISRN